MSAYWVAEFTACVELLLAAAALMLALVVVRHD